VMPLINSLTLPFLRPLQKRVPTVANVDLSPLVLIIVLQLALNALWSWLFFAWHLGAWAFADIVALWALVAATLACFWRVRRLAGALLVPYLLWVSFAAVLNYSVWRLNPQVLG